MGPKNHQKSVPKTIKNPSGLEVKSGAAVGDRGATSPGVPRDGLFLTKISNGALAGAFGGGRKSERLPMLISGGPKMGPKSLDWKGDPPRNRKKVVFGGVRKINGFPVPKTIPFSCSGTTKYVHTFQGS